MTKLTQPQIDLLTSAAGDAGVLLEADIDQRAVKAVIKQGLAMSLPRWRLGSEGHQDRHRCSDRKDQCRREWA